MIVIGSKTPKIINPAQIVYFELIKGKVTAFIKGKYIDGNPVVENINVREPWTVVVHTTVSKHYVNCISKEEAIKYGAAVASLIYTDEHKDDILKIIRRVYERK